MRDTGEPHSQGESGEKQAAAEDPPVGLGGFDLCEQQALDMRVVEALPAQACRPAPTQKDGEDDAPDGDGGDHQRKQIDLAVHGNLGGLRHLLDVREHDDVDGRNEDEATDDGDPTQGLHRRMHRLDVSLGAGGAALVDRGNSLHRHGVGDDVLNDIADGGEKRAQDEPALGAYQPGHEGCVGDQAIHDGDADRDEGGAEIDEQVLPAPEEIDEMAERHLERPWQPDPERQAGEEGSGEPELLLNEERANDCRKPRHAGRQIDHQGWQEGPAPLPRNVDKCRLQPSLERHTQWGAHRFRSQGFAGGGHRVSLPSPAQAHPVTRSAASRHEWRAVRLLTKPRGTLTTDHRRRERSLTLINGRLPQTGMFGQHAETVGPMMRRAVGS